MAKWRTPTLCLLFLFNLLPLLNAAASMLKKRKLEEKCFFFYFEVEISLEIPSHCPSSHIQSIGRFFNDAFDNAFISVENVQTDTEICTNPYQDDNRRHRNLLLQDLQDPREAKSSRSRRMSINRILSSRKSYGLFVYSGGGACRLCLRDDTDLRRLGYWGGSGSGSGGGSVSSGGGGGGGGGGFVLLNDDEGSGSISYGMSGSGGASASSSSSGGSVSVSAHAYHYAYSGQESSFRFVASGNDWDSIDDYLESRLSQYLTDALKERLKRSLWHCMYGLNPTVRVKLYEVNNLSEADPQCSIV